MAAIVLGMSSGHIIQPVAFVRRTNLRPQHFAFASATRVPHLRRRTVSPVVYVTQQLGAEVLQRRVVIASLGDPALDLVPPVHPPPAARLFGTSFYRQGWVPWEKDVHDDARATAHGACGGPVLQELLADYAIVDVVASKKASELVLAVFDAVDINNRPQIATSIRSALLSCVPDLSPKEVTTSLDRNGVIAPDASNRRLTCERILLVLLARAFTGSISPTSSPSPIGIDEILMEDDLERGSRAESIMRSVIAP